MFGLWCGFEGVDQFVFICR